MNSDTKRWTELSRERIAAESGAWDSALQRGALEVRQDFGRRNLINSSLYVQGVYRVCVDDLTDRATQIWEATKSAIAATLPETETLEPDQLSNHMAELISDQQKRITGIAHQFSKQQERGLQNKGLLPLGAIDDEALRLTQKYDTEAKVFAHEWQLRADKLAAEKRSVPFSIFGAQFTVPKAAAVGVVVLLLGWGVWTQGTAVCIEAGLCHAACRDESHGVESWRAVDSISRDSGWVGGGSNPTKYCNGQLTGIQAANPNKRIELVGKTEDHKTERRPFKEDYYRYTCAFKVSEPVYALKRSEACDT